ncbi:MAG: AlwI family type II restriction endonuclease [Eubacteriales bacterium]|nr:AlwI family type II restriction endonuclease [Eubacteriales bacterium]
MPEFKSYCWCIGTTSFRVRDLKYKNEILLQSLNELFSKNPEKTWRELQADFYDLLVKKEFKNGKAKRPDKDARELTSGLADIGLVDSERHITPIGKKISSINSGWHYETDNVLGIAPDSYVYLLQLLKYEETNGDFEIRPFVSFLYLLCKVGKISRAAFTYLLPICRNKNDVVDLLGILSPSPKQEQIDQVLIHRILSMSNYQEALRTFVRAEIVDESTIQEAGMNRKSGQYDGQLLRLFDSLHKCWVDKQTFGRVLAGDAVAIQDSLSSISNANQAAPWRKYLGITKTKNVRTEAFLEQLLQIDVFKATDENDFRKRFFERWHLLKWKATLNDYYDLNKRYFSLADIVKYEDGVFSLTEVAHFYFEDIIDRLLLTPLSEDPAKYQKLLYSDIPINEIFPSCIKTRDDLANSINAKYGKRLTGSELESFLKKQKKEAFIEFIDSRFSKKVLLELLEAFRVRDDRKIHDLVTDDAEPSTCFEYILGIIWFNLSGREQDPEQMFHLTLDANFLPIIHAGGNTPDLEFNYRQTKCYPAHTMLLEATLAEGTGQRHMEWDPVSRHLENQMIASKNKNDYVVFISSVPSLRTIKAFRSMCTYDVQVGDEKAFLKIIPLDCTLLENIVDKDIAYTKLYPLFDQAFKSAKMGEEWYRDEIERKLS